MTDPPKAPSERARVLLAALSDLVSGDEAKGVLLIMEALGAERAETEAALRERIAAAMTKASLDLITHREWRYCAEMWAERIRKGDL